MPALVLDGEALFRVRGTNAYPAELRARSISERIVEVARTPAIAPEAVQAVPADEVVNHLHDLPHPPPGRRGLPLHPGFPLGGQTPWRQVEAMLLMAAERTPGLAREPAPFVLQESLGDFCVVYEVNVPCDDPAQMGALYTQLHRNTLDVFNEYGVQIMTPAYEGGPDQPKMVPKDSGGALPRARSQARRASRRVADRSARSSG